LYVFLHIYNRFWSFQFIFSHMKILRYIIWIVLLNYLTSVIGKVIEKLLNHTRTNNIIFIWNWLYFCILHYIQSILEFSVHIFSYENMRYIIWIVLLNYLTSVIGKVIEKLLNHTRTNNIILIWNWLCVFYIYTIDFGVFSSYFLIWKYESYIMNCTLKLCYKCYW